MIKAYLYDSSGRDHEIKLPSKMPKASAKKLLWVDMLGRDAAELKKIAMVLKLDADCHADLQQKKPAHQLNTYGGYVHFDVAALKVTSMREDTFPEDPTASRLDFVVAQGWLLTIHDEELEFLNQFREQDRGETLIGRLTPDGLASALLDWHLNPYLSATECIEEICDKLDARILQEETMRSDLLPEIVRCQHYITNLRRLLVPQRSVFYGLSRADIALITDNKSAAQMKSLEHRFERALDIVEHGRDVVRSSFDLYSARVGDKTNVLIRRFTFVSVTLGVVGAVAGVFGMNFETPYTKSGIMGFWFVLVALFIFMIIFALVSLWRKWI